jgi:glycosyltransferase involved in cell wall biosynthesis
VIPTVSICIPTYNGEAYLVPAIESAIRQTFHDTEILIVDDASTDETLSIANRIARLDPRLRIISNDHNLGLVKNWNRCLIEARGAWIKFLFQDDLLEPTCVEELLRAAQGSRIPFAACFRGFVFEDGTEQALRERYIKERSEVSDWYRRPTMTADQFAVFAVRQPPRNLVGEPTVTLIRRDLVCEVGLFDPDFIHLCDAEYWLRLGGAAGIAMVPRVLAQFRVHGTSATSVNASERHFRASALDPLLLLYKLLYSPDLVPLRRAATALGLMAEKSFEFWALCHYAQDYAREQYRYGATGPLSDWRALCDRIPLMAHVPLEQVVRRKVRRLFELVGFGR